MGRAPSLAAVLVLALGATWAGETDGPHLRLETRVSPLANLVHWIDNLAGTSAGKTTPIYRRYWLERFGPLDEADTEALRGFVRIRRLRIGGGGRIANRSGCLPVVENELTWHQRFLSEAMQASSIPDLLLRLSPYLEDGDRTVLETALKRFSQRFHHVWGDLSHVQRFERRFRQFLDTGELPAYLDSLAVFLGLDPESLPPMHLSFMALPTDGPTHAEADGDHLLIEIRPGDRPRQQVQVVAHEAVHFLLRRMSPGEYDALAAQSLAAGDAGLTLWSYLWEGLPTALGQGLAEATLARRWFSMDKRWYHVDAIDGFAKLVYPVLREAVLQGRRLQDGVLPEAAAVVGASRDFAEAPLADLLTMAVFIAGPGLEEARDDLRRRLGTSSRGLSLPLSLDDQGSRRWVEDYSCLSAVVMVLPDQLPGTAAFLAAAGIPPLVLESLQGPDAPWWRPCLPSGPGERGGGR
jgi:hypothetical protein